MLVFWPSLQWRNRCCWNCSLSRRLTEGPQEMFKKMVTLETEMKDQLEAKDREIAALRQTAAEHAQTKERLAKAEVGLNAGRH